MTDFRTLFRAGPGVVRQSTGVRFTARGCPAGLAATFAFVFAWFPSTAAWRPVGAAAVRPMQDTSASLVATWDLFSADVTVRRGMSDSKGKRMGREIPPVRYRWERRQEGGGWKTVMTILTATRPPAMANGKPLEIPASVGRVEEDGDGSAPRVYATDGTLIQLPPTALQKLEAVTMSSGDDTLRDGFPFSIPGAASGAGREWVESILPSKSATSKRRRTLEELFGKSVGKLRGLDRFVTTRDGTTAELLADVEFALPVEMNIVRDGILDSHSRFSYEPGPADSLVRRTVHTEQALPNGQGARLVTDVEFANVRLERRR